MLELPVEHSILDNRCPSNQVLEMISGKWTVLVVYALSRGMMRYGELRRLIHGISKKMLTQTLRELERNGLVDRKVYAVVPPKVEYTLSPLGETLVATLSGICNWAEAHLDEVVEAQAVYDAAQALEEDE